MLKRDLVQLRTQNINNSIQRRERFIHQRRLLLSYLIYFLHFMPSNPQGQPESGMKIQPAPSLKAIRCVLNTTWTQMGVTVMYFLDFFTFKKV